MVLRIVMLMVSAIPALAASSTNKTVQVSSAYTPIEEHTVIDCTNRYKYDF